MNEMSSFPGMELPSVQAAPLRADDRRAAHLPRRDLGMNVVVTGRNHPETSRSAADRAYPRSGSFRRELVEWLATRPAGATDDEIELHFRKPHQSASSARSALKSDNWIEALTDQGQTVTRTNRYGNEAIVWTLSRPERTSQHG